MMHLFRFYSYEHMAGDFSHETTCQENHRLITLLNSQIFL